MEKFTVIVLRVIKYRENSSIIKFFSKQGVISVFVDNISKKKSFFEYCNVLDIEVYISKSDIYRLKNVNFSFNSYTPVKIQPLKLFISEILYQILNYENINEDLFDFVYNKIKDIDENIDTKNFILNLLIKISFFLGFFPEKTNKKNYFDLKEGLYCDNIPFHNLYIPEKYISTWNSILEEDKIDFNENNFNIYLKILLTYLKIHIPNFQIPESYQLFKVIV